MTLRRKLRPQRVNQFVTWLPYTA